MPIKLLRQYKSGLIIDSETDLNLARMKIVNKNIINTLKNKLSKDIEFVDNSLTLNSTDFLPLDRHYNKYGHISHANALYLKIKNLSKNLCN